MKGQSLHIGIYLIVLSIIVLSCQNRQQAIVQNEENQLDTAVIKTVSEPVTVEEEVYQPITEKFYQLIQFADSLGYSFDTVRFNPDVKRMNYKGYYVYEMPLDMTIQYAYIDDIDERYRFDLFEKSENIIYYYFKQKKPNVSVGTNGSRTSTFPDGIIEEWVFPSKKDAELAASEMKKAAPVLFFNRGVYLCTIDNYMYVFQSRAYGFMSIQKKFFKYFVKTNDSVLIPEKPSETYWYKEIEIVIEDEEVEIEETIDESADETIS